MKKYLSSFRLQNYFSIIGRRRKFAEKLLENICDNNNGNKILENK